MGKASRIVVLAEDDVEALIERAVMTGIRKAMSPCVSRRQAEKEYGRSTISDLIKKGLIKGRKAGTASNAKMVFDREEIERAIMG